MSDQLRIGVNQPPRSGNDYPFIRESSGANKTILDLWFQYVAELHTPPFRLAVANRIGGNTFNLVPELVIQDDAGEVVFSTQAATYLGRNSWGETYATHRWSQQRSQLTVVVSSELYSEVPDTLAPESLLDPRTHNVVANDVRRVNVYNNGETFPLVSVDDDSLLHLLPGYNMRMDVNAANKTGSGDRVGDAIVFNAIPGEGLGRFDNCGNDEPLIRTINQVESDGGSFLLSDGSCLRVEPKLIFTSDGATIEHGTVKIADDCLPCCDCDDYLRVSRAISRIDRENQIAAESLQDTRDRYVAILEEQEDVLTRAGSELQVRAERNGDCGINVVASRINNGTDPVDDFTFEIAFFELQDDGEYTPVAAENYTAASRFSRLVDVGNTQLTKVNDSTVQTNVGCVYPQETKSVAFGTNVKTNRDVKVCAYEAGNPTGPLYGCACVKSSCSEAAGFTGGFTEDQSSVLP